MLLLPFSAFCWEKCWKSIFRPAFGVRSTQTLVKIYNTCLVSSLNAFLQHVDFSDKDREIESVRQAPQIKQSKSEPIVHRHLEGERQQQQQQQQQHTSVEELRESRQIGATRKSQSRTKVTHDWLPESRDSGNDFRVCKIASIPGHFSFILFSFPHVVSSCFFKRTSFLGWLLFLELTRTD